jgi:cytochrome c oxidase subunit 1
MEQEIALRAVEDRVDLPLVGRLHEWVVTVDHKRLGLMYISGGLFFFVVAGLQAVTIRLQLAFPDNHLVPPQMFNRLMTMHGTAMVFLVGMPILTGFFNYLVPLMVGARDLAFPRLNAFGFWLWFFGALLLYFSYIGGDGLYGAGSAPDVGWFAYAPLTERAFSRGNSTDYWILSIFLTSVGSTATAVNLIATAFSMRCKGMTLGKMPILAWLAVVVAFMMLIALPPL